MFDRRTFTAELIGTFALVFFGTGAVMVDTISGGALGVVGIAAIFGAVVSAVIYGLGEVSGA
ncbi:MAG: aquaporin, partial [Owenweeksia sp.]